MREDLLGYLLGALEAAEHQRVERELQHDPQLRLQLKTLEARLDVLRGGAAEFEPPPGLARRTCDQVTSKPAGEPVCRARQGLAGAMAAEPLAAPASRWTMADMIVAAGVFVSAALLFLPAIANSRYAARIAACQDNLRQLGYALVDYSEKRGQGHFPYVPTSGKRAFAGLYAPLLLEDGFLTTSDRMVCPDSDLPQQFPQWRVPSLAELDQARGPSLWQLQRMSGGSYGYSLGVMVGDRHRAPRHLGRTHFALMADAPSLHLASRQSAHHGRRGQNVLFEDNHIRFIVGCPAEHCLDDPFRNRRGQIQAGVDPDDAVIASSATPPFP